MFFHMEFMTHFRTRPGRDILLFTFRNHKDSTESEDSNHANSKTNKILIHFHGNRVKHTFIFLQLCIHAWQRL